MRVQGTSRPRIGIDARYLQLPGVGRYVETLLRGLKEAVVGASRREWPFDVVAYVNSDTPVPDGLEDLEFREVSWRIFTVSQQLRWWRRVTDDQLGLFHSPHYDAPLLLPCPLVVTIHDLVYFRFPPAGLGGLARRAYYTCMHRAVVRRAQNLIAVSEFTNGELQDRLGVRLRPDAVILNGCVPYSEHNPPVERPNAGRYILNVGTWKPWKNIPRLLEAFAEVRKVDPELQLVLAGKQGKNDVQVVSRQDGVLVVGEVSEPELRGLYRHAQLVVCPSLYEGFGLSALEAMREGAPVLVSRGGALEEVAGGVGLTFDATDSDELASAILRLLASDDRSHMQEISRQRAAQLDHVTMARKTAALYSRVLESAA